MTYFQYGDLNTTRKLDLTVRRPRPKKEDEQLTGRVQGQPASDLEERFARALYRYSMPFDFQVFVMTAISLPHQQKEVDFIVGQQPVNVHGFIGHRFTIGQKGYDWLRDRHIDEALRPMGFMPIITITEKELGRQEDADTFVRRRFK